MTTATPRPFVPGATSRWWDDAPAPHGCGCPLPARSPSPASPHRPRSLRGARRWTPRRPAMAPASRARSLWSAPTLKAVAHRIPRKNIPRENNEAAITRAAALQRVHGLRGAGGGWRAPGWRSACTNPAQKAMVPARRTRASPTWCGFIPSAAMAAASLTWRGAREAFRSSSCACNSLWARREPMRADAPARRTREGEGDAP